MTNDPLIKSNGLALAVCSLVSAALLVLSLFLLMLAPAKAQVANVTITATVNQQCGVSATEYLTDGFAPVRTGNLQCNTGAAVKVAYDQQTLAANAPWLRRASWNVEEVVDKTYVFQKGQSITFDIPTIQRPGLLVNFPPRQSFPNTVKITVIVL